MFGPNFFKYTANNKYLKIIPFPVKEKKRGALHTCEETEKKGESINRV